MICSLRLSSPGRQALPLVFAHKSRFIIRADASPLRRERQQRARHITRQKAALFSCHFEARAGLSARQLAVDAAAKMPATFEHSDVAKG